MNRSVPLGAWEFASGAADAPETPGRWRPAEVPGTAASSLRALDALDFTTRMDFDAVPWWFRCHFPCSPAAPETRTVLRLEGLATHATVTLNGELLLTSDNMFVAHELDVSAHLQPDNELVLHFPPLAPRLSARRERPRWKTRLVAHQQLRWHRTTLLGRMPSWSPPFAPVGPWRPVQLEQRGPISWGRRALRAELRGPDGWVTLEGVLLGLKDASQVRLHVGAQACDVEVSPHGVGEVSLRAEVRVPDVERWWPHAHGDARLYQAELTAEVGGQTVTLPLGQLGFRTLEAQTAEGAFTVVLNGTPIFCRGACWTPLDMLSLGGSEAAYRDALETVRKAGMNMLRLSGTMVYEAEVFHRLCDELGILVWQDFMFANMDYPVEDPAFAKSIREEATQLLTRIGGGPSLAVLCGNSEIDQQRAMLGLPADASNRFFDVTLPSLIEELAPGVPYLRSTPSGGALPFHVDQGVGHYYGVGAYRRPLEDARRAQVRFASECLAFSNVPSQQLVDELLPHGGPAHHPIWKARVPRDTGAGWDFEDVRDHYLEVLFRVRPLEVRTSDPERYLALSRVVSGEVMGATLSEWRRAGSPCQGALLWFWRDLWPGAGWGLLDASGHPKAAYWFARRACLARAVALSDEGVNGLVAHAFNDGPGPFEGALRYTALREDGRIVREAQCPWSLARRAQRSLHVETLLGHFSDSAYAYRFGPPPHDLAHLELLDDQGASVASAFHFPQGLSSTLHDDVGLEARVSVPWQGRTELHFTSRRFAQCVSLQLPGFQPSDDFFHVVPGRPVRVTLSPLGTSSRLQGSAQALNSRQRVTFQQELPTGGNS